MINTIIRTAIYFLIFVLLQVLVWICSLKFGNISL